MLGLKLILWHPKSLPPGSMCSIELALSVSKLNFNILYLNSIYLKLHQGFFKAQFKIYLKYTLIMTK